MQKIIKAVVVCVCLCVTTMAPYTVGSAQETSGNDATNEEQERLSWPTTVDAAVSDLLARLSPENKEKIRKMKKDNLIRLHHSLGMGIRNRYGLWRGNEALIKSACGKPCHPDHASVLIIEALWMALQKSDK